MSERRRALAPNRSDSHGSPRRERRRGEKVFVVVDEPHRLGPTERVARKSLPIQIAVARAPPRTRPASSRATPPPRTPRTTTRRSVHLGGERRRGRGKSAPSNPKASRKRPPRARAPSETSSAAPTKVTPPTPAPAPTDLDRAAFAASTAASAASSLSPPMIIASSVSSCATRSRISARTRPLCAAPSPAASASRRNSKRSSISAWIASDISEGPIARMRAIRSRRRSAAVASTPDEPPPSTGRSIPPSMEPAENGGPDDAGARGTARRRPGGGGASRSLRHRRREAGLLRVVIPPAAGLRAVVPLLGLALALAKDSGGGFDAASRRGGRGGRGRADADAGGVDAVPFGVRARVTRGGAGGGRRGSESRPARALDIASASARFDVPFARSVSARREGRVGREGPPVSEAGREGGGGGGDDARGRDGGEGGRESTPPHPRETPRSPWRARACPRRDPPRVRTASRIPPRRARASARRARRAERETVRDRADSGNDEPAARMTGTRTLTARGPRNNFQHHLRRAVAPAPLATVPPSRLRLRALDQRSRAPPDAPRTARRARAMSFVEGIKAIPVDLARVRTREEDAPRGGDREDPRRRDSRRRVRHPVRHPSHAPAPPAARRGLARARRRPRGGVHRARRPLRRRPARGHGRVPPRGRRPRGRRAERGGVPCSSSRGAEPPSNAAAAAIAASPSNPDETASDGLPVALFVHGGVWAVGEKWQFAPMASRLAEEGVVACVATYTLFPDALAPRMWAEVSDAVTFAIDNARRFGGSGDKVTLVGHSAGAHICAMALLERCRAADDARNRQSSPGGTPIAGSDRGERSDPRQPRRFVGLCGVYDIAKHYAYEDGRGVALISTMARAMGGRERFDACSPTKAVERGGARAGEDSDAPESDADARAARSDASSPLTPLSPPRRAAAASAAWVPMGIMDTDEMVDVDTILAATNANAERRRGGGPEAETLSRNRKPSKPERTKPSGPPPTPRRRRGGITGPAPGSFAGDDAAALAGYLRDDDDEAGFILRRARDGADGARAAGSLPSLVPLRRMRGRHRALGRVRGVPPRAPRRGVREPRASVPQGAARVVRARVEAAAGGPAERARRTRRRRSGRARGSAGGSATRRSGGTGWTARSRRRGSRRTGGI